MEEGHRANTGEGHAAPKRSPGVPPSQYLAVHQPGSSPDPALEGFLWRLHVGMIDY